MASKEDVAASASKEGKEEAGAHVQPQQRGAWAAFIKAVRRTAAAGGTREDVPPPHDAVQQLLRSWESAPC